MVFYYKNRVILMLCMFLFSLNAEAEDSQSNQLIIEDILTKKGKTSVDVSFAFANFEGSQAAVGDYIPVQVGDTSFIYLPVVNQENSNRDTIVSTLSIRHGLTNKTEAYVRVSGVYDAIRIDSGGGVTEESHSTTVSDMWLGVAHRFKDDDETPAIVGFIEGAAFEKSNSKNQYAKSYQIGLTAYKAIDPIVLSLTSSYRYNKSHKFDGGRYSLGNQFTISPSVAFAVNDKISLTTGFQFIYQNANRVNSQRSGINRTQTNLSLGLSYGLSKRVSFP